MAQSQRDRLATVIRGWHGAAQSLDGRPAVVAACEPLLLALGEHLGRQSTMAGLAETYLADGGGWPVDLPRPVGVSTGVAVEVVVAASYWRRYRQLIDRATARQDAPPAAISASEIGDHSADDPATDLDPIDLGYVVKLWQRGPQRLRCVPIERLHFYRTMIEEAYARMAGCETVCELASRYLADGDWVLEVAQKTLPRLGERPSTIGWVQDAACWRRYQELTAERIRREECERPHPAFSHWLAQHMTRHHLSVPELAHRLTIDEAVVRGWLAARALPDPEHGSRLAALFGLSEAQWPRVPAVSQA